MPARRASAWNTPLCSATTITTQAKGVTGLPPPSFCVISMFSTRNAQYSWTSVGVLRVTSTKACNGLANHARPLVRPAAISTPNSRLTGMVQAHSCKVTSKPWPNAASSPASSTKL
ncbi:hypothetical protein D9M68_855350 [compost metagenome]